MRNKKKKSICCEPPRKILYPIEDDFCPHNPLNRPKMHYKKPIIATMIYILLFVALMFIPFNNIWTTVLALAVYSILYFSVIAKRAIIWTVHLYQNLAPDSVRLKCVFEPSCSEYMIMAVEKYGVIKGVCKGLDRLYRCGSEQGIDYP